MGIPKRINQRARVQHGLVSRGQLTDAGVAERTLGHWLETGRLERVHAGVYRLAGAPITWEQQAMAAVLGSTAVLSHRAAARLWGLADHDEFEITTAGARPRRGGVVVHRSGDLAERHATRRRGIPVTTPMRTLVDLGAVDKEGVADALERAVIARVCSIVALERVLDDVARKARRGAGVLRKVLDERALGRARPDGLLESRMARLLREAGLPEPVFQHHVGRHRIDFAYPEVKLAIEVDGFEVHGTPQAFQRDLARQNRLVAAGWRVLRFTWLDVVRRPEWVAAQVGATLGMLSRAA